MWFSKCPQFSLINVWSIIAFLLSFRFSVAFSSPQGLIMKPERNFPLTQDRVSLWLFSPSSSSLFYFQLLPWFLPHFCKCWTGRVGKWKPVWRLNNLGHVHVRQLPDVPFFSARTQQHRHRTKVRQIPLTKQAAIVVTKFPVRSFHSMQTTRDIPLRQKLENLEVSSRRHKTFPSLGNFDSSSSSEICLQLRAQGEQRHTSGRSDVRERVDRCVSLTGQVEAGRWIIFKNSLWAHVACKFIFSSIVKKVTTCKKIPRWSYFICCPESSCDVGTHDFFE